MRKKTKTFREKSNSAIVDNLIIIHDDDVNCINIKVTCGRDGYLVFTKRQAISIAKYLNEIAKE
jgi:hypothetical protein